ncbi:T9SS type A sorting domain-containing protein [Flavipsychrobacter stenotrophus]|nr:PKD domain-containing protein [Flavipsychrobacter stenotrophus]
MKRHFQFFLYFLLIVLSNTVAYAQQYQWVKTGGTNFTMPPGYSNESSYFTTTDPNGNVYSVNIVANTAIYADTFYRSSGYGSNNNALLTSYDCLGNMRWAKLIGASAVPYILGLTADSIGHVYICGTFTHGILRIGYDTTIPNSTSNQVAAVIQFDTSGHLNWLRWVGPNTAANYYASGIALGTLALDGQQNAHFLKLFRAGSQITPTVLSVSGHYDLAYDASGTLLTATQIQLDTMWKIHSAAIDRYSGKLYACGFPSGYAPGAGGNFVAAFDINRNMVWTDSMHDVTIPGAGGFSGIVCDNNGHLYLSATGTGMLTYRGDTVRNPVLWGGATSFVVKTDTFGNPFWITGYAASTGVNWFESITPIRGSKVAIAGVMAGIVVSGNDTMASYSGEGQNSFFSILDTGGYVHSIEQIHGNAFYDHAYTISSDKVGNLFIGGYFSSDIWGGSLPHITSVGGNTDFCVVKYGVSCGCTAMPLAAFTHSGNPFVTFTYSGTVTGIDSVRWYFGDGGTATSYSTTHNYTTPGTYIVSVSIYSACGNDIRFATIVVPCVAAPVTAFTSSGTSAIRNFTYTGTTAGIDSVSWNFGDGGHGVGLTPSHTYLAAGTYNVCATAYNPCGNHTICHTVNITCTAAIAPAFTHTGFGPINFTYTGTTAALDSVVWHYGDGGHGAGLASAHTYISAGIYTACALTYSQCGVDSVCDTITLPCVSAPIASFTSSGSPAVTFTYTGTTAGMDSLTWDFGDGLTDTGTAPSHTYTTTDTFHVCVIVYTPCGSDTVCTDVIATGVGINDPANALTHISIYPTPTADLLNISGITTTTRYRLFSLTGTTLQDGTLQTGNNTLNVSNLPPGVYLLQFSNDNGARTTARVIKQ